MLGAANILKTITKSLFFLVESDYLAGFLLKPENIVPLYWWWYRFLDYQFLQTIRKFLYTNDLSLYKFETKMETKLCCSPRSVVTPSDQISNNSVWGANFYNNVLDFITKNTAGCRQNQHLNNSRVWHEDINTNRHQLWDCLISHRSTAFAL